MGKLLLNLLFLIFLSGCFQTTAMVGPTMTLVSTGNLGHALGTFVTNTAVEKETGMNTHQLLAKKVEEQQLKQEDNIINKKLSKMLETNVANKQLVILLQNNINKTKKKINSN
tara:strand:+ start:106 stop:444 length:339 start_codon:yes stop_codon:yes gene_type:complete